MYDYFNEETLRGNRFLTVGGLEIIGNYYEKEIGKIRQYYERVPNAVLSNHFLVRLITHLLGHYNTKSGFDIYQGIQYKVDDLGMAMKLTSNLFRGELKQNSFYGKEVTEAILLYNKPYTEYYKSDWKTWRPINVISHASTDVIINPLKPIIDPSQKGLTFIIVDAVQLTMQYYLWKAELNEKNDRSMMQFIATYPLPNLLYSHADTAIWNRFVYIYHGVKMPENRNKFPIAIADYSRSFDKGLLKVAENLKRRHVTFEDILLTTPLLYHKDVSSLFKVPHLYPLNRNNLWFFLGSRLRYFRFLFRYSKDIDNHGKNKSDIAYIKRELRILKVERIFEQVMDGSPLAYCNGELENLINS